jgi:hypothetical protein
LAVVFARAGHKVALCDALAGEVEARSLPKSRNASDSRSRRRCFIQVEAAVIHRLRATRRPGESYRQVILRLVALETSDLK